MKRRKLYILTLILLLQTIFCMTGKSQDIDYFAIFDHLNPDSIPTGILYDKAFPVSNILEFDGKDSTEIADTMVMTKKEWDLIYNELLSAYVDSVSIPTFQNIQDTLTEFYEQQLVPIYIVNMEYNRLKDNAINDHLLEFVNDQLYDVPNPPESPYRTVRYFSAIALPLNLDGDDFIFKLDSSLYISNNDDTIQSIDIDFGNNLLFKGLNLNSEITINRSELRDTAKLTVHLRADSILVCKFEIKTDAENNAPNLKSLKVAPAECDSCDDVFSEDFGILYHLKHYGAKFGVLFGCKTTSIDSIKKPVIFVEGWDPINSRSLQGIFNESNVEFTNNDESKNGLFRALQNQGFDVILMSFNNGGGAIQGNALVLRNFINHLNHTLDENKSNNNIVVIGESMGGLVCRYALRYMESIGEDHRTRLLMTIDTPHQGAHLTYAIQHIGASAFELIQKIEAYCQTVSIVYASKGTLIMSVLNVIPLTLEILLMDLKKLFYCEASKQMLVYYEPDSRNPSHPNCSPERTQLLADFESLGNGGYPANVDKMVGLSFGSAKSQLQNWSHDDTIYFYDDPLNIEINKETQDSLYLFDNLRVNMFSIPDHVRKNILRVYGEKTVPAPPIPFWPLYVWLHGRPITYSINLFDLTVEGTLPYENAPGGFLNFGTKEIVSVLDGALKTKWSDTIGNNCFVPTVSSLDLKGRPLNYNVYEHFTESSPNSNYYEMNDRSITPFDAFYVEEGNKEHGQRGTTGQMIKKVYELIVGDDNLLLKDKFILNKKQQYEASNRITLDNVHVSTSLPLLGNGALYLQAGQTITFDKDFSVGKNCTFEIVTQDFCK
jgi:hypothetical protein